MLSFKVRLIIVSIVFRIILELWCLSNQRAHAIEVQHKKSVSESTHKRQNEVHFKIRRLKSTEKSRNSFKVDPFSKMRSSKTFIQIRAKTELYMNVNEYSKTFSLNTTERNPDSKTSRSKASSETQRVYTLMSPSLTPTVKSSRSTTTLRLTIKRKARSPRSLDTDLYRQYGGHKLPSPKTWVCGNVSLPIWQLIWSSYQSVDYYAVLCSCDNLCQLFQDCCFFYDQQCRGLERKTSQTNKQSARQSGNTTSIQRPRNVTDNRSSFNNKINLNTITCIDQLCGHLQCTSHHLIGHLFHDGRTTRYYWLVSSCPESQKNSTLSKYCENPDLVKLSSHIPVSDALTGISFRNIFCALCHNFQELVPWKINIFSARIQRVSDYSHEDLVKMAMSMTDNIFSILFEPEIKSRECIPDHMLLAKECNETGQWKEYDSQLEALCESYTNPILAKVSRRKQLKNYHCALCNGFTVDIHDDNKQCEGKGLWY